MNEEKLMEIASNGAKTITKHLSCGPSWRTWHFAQHLPGYIDAEPFEMDFTRIKDVLEHEQVKWWAEQPKFYGFFIKHTFTGYNDTSLLMAFSDYHEEFYGCMSWYVLGYITGNGRGYIDLDIADPKFGIHKPTCWSRKYESVEKDLISRPDKEVMDILQKIGWQKNTLDGYAALCDCGYDAYLNSH